MKLEKYFDEDMQRHYWRVDFTLAHRRIREKKFRTRAAAEEFILDLKIQAREKAYQLTQPPPPPPPALVSLVDLLEAYFDHVRQRNSYSSVRSTLLSFAGFFPEGAFADIRDLKRKHISSFALACRKIGLAISTVQNYVSTVHGMLQAAPLLFPELEDWTPPNIKLGDIGLRGTGARRERILTSLEAVAIHRALASPRQKSEAAHIHQWRRRDLSDLFLLCLLTGKRPNEIYKLKWPQVNFALNRVHWDLSKTATKQTLPLTPLVREILQARQHRGLKRPFESFTKQRISQCLRRAGKLSGVPYGNTSDKWTLYTLRHTAATILFEANVDPTVRQNILGHAISGPTTNRYTHISNEVLEKALLTLEHFWQKACRDFDGTKNESMDFKVNQCITEASTDFRKAQ